MPTTKFNSQLEADFFRARAAEQHRLFCPPRKWLVNNDQINLNIYGEPGQPITGTDGVTSVAATRRFTSASADFVAAGLIASDIVEIQDPADNQGDNGRYAIATVVSAHILTISQDWPVGSRSGLVFNIHLQKERYTELPQRIPFILKLEPTKKTLDKWGIQEQRDAMVILSTKLCDDVGLTPKIGDRFVHDYSGREIHYELRNLFETDSLTNTGKPIHYLGFATRTTNRLP
jgi:hypothetical protein